MPKRRILTDFRLDKIAAVDDPCQEGARVAIMKRREDEEMDTITKKEHDDLIAKLNGDWQKKLDDLTKKVEKALADNEELVLKAKMSDDEKECMSGMKDEEKKKFLSMPVDERKAEVAKRKTSDESVVLNGVTIFKSKTDPAVFEALKGQEAINKKNLDDIAKARDEAETAIIEKRVDADFSKVIGTTKAKAAIFKALRNAPKDAVDAFEAIMKAAQDITKGAFEQLGHGNGKETAKSIAKARDNFMAKVSMVQDRDKLSRVMAMSKAREEFPAEFEAYQNGGEEQAAA